MTAAVLRADERLQRSVVGYWLLSDSLRTAVFAALLWYVGRPLLQELRPDLPSTWPQLLLAGLLLLGLLTVLLPPLAYARWRIGFADNLLLMRYGILFVEERAVPVQRMQHVDLLRGPIERLFGLATLVVYTAGNEGSAFRVPGLALARAQELREAIVQARGDGQL